MIKLQGEVYKSTIIIGYFKAIFSITVKKSSQQIHKIYLNNNIKPFNQIDFCGTLNPKTAEHTVFQAHTEYLTR